MLEPFGSALHLAEGPTVSFLGVPYPTRMALARLGDGSVWVWSPIELDDELAFAIEELGPVRYVVSPNKIHHLFMGPWKEHWPEARLFASPGLASRRRDLAFDAVLGDDPDPAWADDIDQVIFHGSFAMEEVVFFHRPSSTALVCDLVQRHDPASFSGWQRWLMRADALLGEEGSTPREWRATFLRRARARAARAKLLSWKPDRLLIAHGACASHGATDILTRALAWI